MNLMKNAHGVHHRYDLFIAVHHCMAVCHGGLAVAVLVGGVPRFPPPTYQSLLDMTNGVIWPWGVALMASSVMMCSRFVIVDMLGILIGMFCMASWSIAFAVALQYPQAGATAFVAYAALFGINFSLLAQRCIEYERRTRTKGG